MLKGHCGGCFLTKDAIYSVADYAYNSIFYMYLNLNEMTCHFQWLLVSYDVICMAQRSPETVSYFCVMIKRQDSCHILMKEQV